LLVESLILCDFLPGHRLLSRRHAGQRAPGPWRADQLLGLLGRGRGRVLLQLRQFQLFLVARAREDGFLRLFDLKLLFLNATAH